jgi:hypothetical protein
MCLFSRVAAGCGYVVWSRLWTGISGGLRSHLPMLPISRPNGRRILGPFGKAEMEMAPRFSLTAAWRIVTSEGGDATRTAATRIDPESGVAPVGAEPRMKRGDLRIANQVGCPVSGPLPRKC